MKYWVGFVLFLACSMPAFADERAQTLADIRQELSYLFVEVKKLRQELSTTASVSGVASSDSLVARVDAIEQALQGLTGATEALQFKVERVVEDGTSRIADLEFRLVELEGGDISTLGETSTLGGYVETALVAPKTETAELAVGEEADFSVAETAFEEERYGEAAQLFGRFSTTYPSSPLMARAYMLRGKALEANDDVKNGARAYLESFSNYPNDPVAPEVLTLLGKALVKLGQVDAGCQTLSQVEIRFPDTAFAAEAEAELKTLQCL